MHLTGLPRRDRWLAAALRGLVQPQVMPLRDLRCTFRRRCHPYPEKKSNTRSSELRIANEGIVCPTFVIGTLYRVAGAYLPSILQVFTAREIHTYPRNAP